MLVREEVKLAVPDLVFMPLAVPVLEAVLVRVTVAVAEGEGLPLGLGV